MVRKRALILCIIYASVFQSQTAELRNALRFFDNHNSCYFEHYGRPLSEAAWIEGVDISTKILDVEPSFTELYTAKSRNIREITNVKINGREVKYKYVDILLVRRKQNDLELIMTLGTGFRYYEEYETSEVMKVNITFLCENGNLKSLEIRQKIIDTNNHDPEFIPNDFEFKIPYTVEENRLIGQITARDIDLTNNNISFNFRSTGNNTYESYALLGVYQDQYDPKTFYAWFVTIANVSLQNNETISIFAQDSGKPSRIATADVRLFPTDSFTTTTTTITITTTVWEVESPLPPPGETSDPQSPHPEGSLFQLASP